MAATAAVLSFLGLLDEIFLWKVLIFQRDIRIDVFEVVYAFGFAEWVSYLCEEQGTGVSLWAAGRRCGFLFSGAVRDVGNAASVWHGGNTSA